MSRKIYSTYDKAAMTAVCRSADRAIHSARIIYHVPDPGFDSLLPDGDNSFATLRHGNHYKPRSKKIHHHHHHRHHKSKRIQSPRGARRLERLTAKAALRAADHISEHLATSPSPYNTAETPTPNASAAKALQFPSRLPSASRPSSRGGASTPDSISSQLSIDVEGVDEDYSSSSSSVSTTNDFSQSTMNMTPDHSGIEGMLKISAAKTAGRIWRGKTQITRASTPRGGGSGVLLIAAATVKVEEAEVMSERCQVANKQMIEAIALYEPELDKLNHKIEHEFLPMTRKAADSRGYSKELVDTQLDLARDKVEKAKESVYKFTPKGYHVLCEEAKQVVASVGQELWKVMKKAEASEQIDKALERLNKCRDRASSSDMGIDSVLEQSSKLRQLLEDAEKEAQMPQLLPQGVVSEDLFAQSATIVVDWAKSLDAIVSKCEKVLDAELKKLKMDRLSKFDNIKKAFEKPSPEIKSRKPSRRASSYVVATPRLSLQDKDDMDNEDHRRHTNWNDSAFPSSIDESPLISKSFDSRPAVVESPASSKSFDGFPSPKVNETGKPKPHRHMSLYFAPMTPKDPPPMTPVSEFSPSFSMSFLQNTPDTPNTPDDLQSEAPPRLSDRSIKFSPENDQTTSNISPKSPPIASPSIDITEMAHNMRQELEMENDVADHMNTNPSSSQQVPNQILRQGRDSEINNEKISKEIKPITVPDYKPKTESQTEVKPPIARSAKEVSQPHHNHIGSESLSNHPPSESKTMTMPPSSSMMSNFIPIEEHEDILKTLLKDKEMEMENQTSSMMPIEEHENILKNFLKEKENQTSSMPIEEHENILKNLLKEKEMEMDNQISLAIEKVLVEEKKNSLQREKEIIHEENNKSDKKEKLLHIKLKEEYEIKERIIKFDLNDAIEEVKEWQMKHNLLEQELLKIRRDLSNEKEMNITLSKKIDFIEKVLKDKEEKEIEDEKKKQNEKSNGHSSLIESSFKTSSHSESVRKELGTFPPDTTSTAMRHQSPFPNEGSSLPPPRILRKSTSVPLKPPNQTLLAPAAATITSPPPRNASPSLKKKFPSSSPPPPPSSPPPPSTVPISSSASTPSRTNKKEEDKLSPKPISERIPIEDPKSPTAVRISKFSQHLSKKDSNPKRDPSPIADRIAQWKQKAGGSIYGTGDTKPVDQEMATTTPTRTVRSASPMTQKIEAWKKKKEASGSMTEDRTRDDDTGAPVLKQGAAGVPPPPPLPPPSTAPPSSSTTTTLSSSTSYNGKTKTQSSRASSAPVRTPSQEVINDNKSRENDMKTDPGAVQGQPKSEFRSLAPTTRRTRASSVTTRQRSRSSTLIAQRLATWNDRGSSTSSSLSAMKPPSRAPSSHTSEDPPPPPPPAPSAQSSDTSQRYSQRNPSPSPITSTSKFPSPRRASRRSTTPGQRNSSPYTARTTPPTNSLRSQSPRSSIVATSSSRFRTSHSPRWGEVVPSKLVPPPPVPLKTATPAADIEAAAQKLEEYLTPPQSSVLSALAPGATITKKISNDKKMSNTATLMTSPLKSRSLTKKPPPTVDVSSIKQQQSSPPETAQTLKVPLSPSSRVTQSHDSILPTKHGVESLKKVLSPNRSKNNGNYMNSVSSLLSPSGIAKSPPITPRMKTLTSNVLKEDILTFHKNVSLSDSSQSQPKTENEIKYMINKLEMSAENGSVHDQFELGFALFEGIDGVEQNLPEAARWFRKAADQSMAEAQFNLGLMYDEGIGLPKSDTKAVAWYLYAADQQFPPAQFNLGVMYHHGRGVPQSDLEAAKWWTQAAEHGDVDAMAGLGSMYRLGKGVPKSPDEAASWYLKAAELNHPVASAFLGCCYRYGNGVTQSDSEAVKWFSKASENGHLGASAVLGLLYMDGKGVVRNGKSAWRSLSLASSTKSFGLLTLYYVDNEGLSRDLKKARDLCTLAAVQGNEHAKILLRTHFPADLML